MNKKFQERLKYIRKNNDLSQAELAKRTGLQPSAISHFETGNRLPSLDNLNLLANALGTSTDYLLGRTDSKEISGPVIEQIFKNLKRMSLDDQNTLAEMSSVLARKSKSRNT